VKIQQVRAGVWQGGPARGPIDTTAIELLESPSLPELDLLLLSELALSPYVAVATRPHPDSAMGVDSREFQRIGKVAANRQMLIAVPFMERGEAPGVYYNSIAVVGPEGLIEAEMISGPHEGSHVATYRKVHLSENRSSTPGVHEKFHFRPGDGFVIWRTPIGSIAPLICYDRSFPESWRTVVAAGAEIVVVPIATSRPERRRMLKMELQVAAMQSGVFVVAACKAGRESLGDVGVEYSGGSLIVAPDGSVTAEADEGIEGEVLVGALARSQLEDYARVFHYARDRRPETYRFDRHVHSPTSSEETP